MPLRHAALSQDRCTWRFVTCHHPVHGKRHIFRKASDLYDFIEQLERLIPATRNRCYAWALMSNPAYFLFRSGPAGLARLMRRWLTGYAISFNRRYKRHGQLFQNRCKSIICQEDTHLCEVIYSRVLSMSEGLAAPS